MTQIGYFRLALGGHFHPTRATRSNDAYFISPVLFDFVGKNTIIRDSVIMSGTKVGENVVIEKAIIGSGAAIRRGCRIGNGNNIAVIAAKEDIKSSSIVDAIEKEV